MMLAAVLLAGAGGAVLRFLVTRLLPSPWAVLAVNVAGSLLAGLFVGLTFGELQLILLTGLCGGLTTFSTFSVETVQLVLSGRARLALVSVASNLVLGIGAAALGYLLAS